MTERPKAGGVTSSARVAGPPAHPSRGPFVSRPVRARVVGDIRANRSGSPGPSTRYESSDRPQRPSVSEPYNFRHLQHVASNEASRLHHAISVDSFSTIRTARPASRRLQDIKAERFPSSFRLSPDLPGARRTIGRSPPVSPCSMPPDHRGDNSDGSPLVSDTPGEAGHPTWREDESKGTRRRSAQSTMSIIPPPRTSSRNAFTHVDDPVLMSPSTASHLSDGADSADRKFERVDLRASDVSIRPGSAGSLDESTWQFEELQLPHAVTTPDDTAWPLKPATVADGRPGLADVPEEDEGYFSPRLDPTSPKESSFTPSWPSCSHGQTLSVTHTSRTSLSSVDSTTQARDSFRSQSQVSEPLERDSFVRVVKGPSETPNAPGSISIQVRDLDASWEDDIDYCYEHAVEADCAYDWDWNPDEDTPTKDGQATSGMSADEYSAIVPSASSHRSSGSVDGLQTMSAGQATLGHLPDQPICRHRPNLLVRTADETPILELSSAVTSMNGSELVTPSPLEVRLSSAHPFKNSGITVVDPSLRFTDQDNSWTPEETLDVGSPTGGVHATTTHIPDEPMTNRLDSLPGLLGDSEVGSSSRQSEEVATGHQSSRPGPTDNATQIIAEARCVEVGLAEPVAHNCSAPADETSGGSLQKAFSHDDVHSSQHSYSPMLNRARSPSEGTGKGMAGTRRKPDPRAIKRNRSMSAIGLSRAQPPTRASYALFPLAS